MNLRTVVAAATMALAAAGLVAIPAGAAHAAVACEVSYQKTFDNGRQFGATLTIANLGEPVNGWTVGFRFDAGQRVSRGWSAAWSQRGAAVTARSLSWNARLDTGATATIGFTGSHRGANPDPTAFTLNGVPCVGAPPTPVELVVSTTALSVPERGSAAFLVRLSVAPAAPVTVTTTAGVGDTDLTVIAGGTLTFTPSTWDAPQEVRVAAAGDADIVNGTRQLTVAAPGLTPVVVVATELDDSVVVPEPGVIIAPTVLTVAEGGSNTFTVRMGSAPPATITLTIVPGGGDPDLTVCSASTLIFTPATWTVPQSVAICAAEDPDMLNGSRTFIFGGIGLSTLSVTVVEADNDVS